MMMEDLSSNHPITSNEPPDKCKSRMHKCCELMKTKLFVILVVGVCVTITLICVGFVVSMEDDNDYTYSVDAWDNEKLSDEQKFWYAAELDELKLALTVTQNTRRAKNVILFVGDGMGPATVTGTRIYRYKEEGRMSWEEFPHMGMLKTYCMDKQVPDSTATATALFGGVKANYETGGVDAAVGLANCTASLDPKNQVDSIIHWAQEVGMSTGFVTNTRVVHATPSALYAHIADRRWECESAMSDAVKAEGCIDIARQLVESAPGRNINVIMGGGRQCLVSNVTGTETDPIDTWSCHSMDGRNLIETWNRDKNDRRLNHAFVENNEQLSKLNTDEVDYVLGIFANGHLRYEDLRDNGPKGMPSLKDMTSAAIKILSRNEEKGFILVVEGGLVDQAHHRGWAKRAFNEVVAMDDAVKEALRLMASHMDDTLIIVTSDHSHTLSINGYAAKGSSIFGVAQNSKFDNVPYTTLTYGTGHDGYQVETAEDGTLRRVDPSQQDTEAFDYVQQVAVKTDENTHGGTDVTVHAIGPMAHLFHRVHEQTFVAHVISYAARIGRFRDNEVLKEIIDFIGI